MASAQPVDPKMPIRCPGGCGGRVYFTDLAKCVHCGKVRCSSCVKRFRGRPYCKRCAKELQRQESLQERSRP